MRITGGHFRGRQLPHQRGAQVRPTSDRVREALFSILGQNLEGCRVLDVYAGSGILAFEAISRGAESALCFDRDRKALKQLERVITELNVGARMVARQGVVPGCLPPTGAFDIVFVDPPYTQDAGPVLKRLSSLLQGVLVLEHAGEAPEIDALERVDQREYGGTKLSFYRGRDAGLSS